MILDENQMVSANDNGVILFDPIEDRQDIEIIIEQIPDDDDELVRRWRIQLDVTTTRKKLKEIEKIINEKVKPLF